MPVFSDVRAAPVVGVGRMDAPSRFAAFIMEQSVKLHVTEVFFTIPACTCIRCTQHTHVGAWVHAGLLDEY